MNAKVFHYWVLSLTDVLKTTKAQVLRAQWMSDAERFEMDVIHKGFKEAVSLAQK